MPHDSPTQPSGWTPPDGALKARRRKKRRAVPSGPPLREPAPLAGFVSAVLAALAILLCQVFYGGLLRPMLALPGLAILAVAAVVAGLLVFRKGGSAPWLWPAVVALAFCLWMGGRVAEGFPTAELAGWQRLVLGCAVAYWLFAAALTDPRHRMAFLAVLFVGMLIQSGVSAWQFLREPSAMPIPWVSEQLREWYGGRPSTRAHGFFFNGNHLAWFLNVGALFALSLGCWSRWPSWARIVCVYAAAVGFAACLPTLSRGGFIGLSVGLTVFLIASVVSLIMGGRGRRMAVTLAVFGGAAVAAGSAFLVFTNSFQIQERLARLTQETYRPVVLEVTARQFQLDPLLGTGPGSFRVLSRQFRPQAVATDDMWAHNDWVQLAAEYGYPAFALLMMFVILHAGGGLAAVGGGASRANGEPSHVVALAVGALAAFAACTVHSIFDFNMQITANALLAACVAGMLANPGYIRRNRGARVSALSAGVARTLPVLVAGLGVFLFAVIWRDAGKERTLLDAENALLSGRPSEARALSARFLSAHPSDYDMRVMRARAALDDSPPDTTRAQRVQDAREAAADLHAASELAPLDAFGEITLATAEGRIGNFSAAETAASRAIRLYPFFHGGYEILGLALVGQQRNEEAIGIHVSGSQLPDSQTIRERLKTLREIQRAQTQN
jgi:hypothetical protein